MIAYDTNILIYALEGVEPWAKAAQTLVRLGEHEGAVLSVLAWQELVTGAVLGSGKSEQKITSVLNDLSATKFVPVTLAISRCAVGLTNRYGKRLYGYDAIHLATAIEHGAQTFVTNDKALLGTHLKELKISSL